MKTEEVTSPGTIHLSPSAATPFTHDHLNSHKKMIDEVLDAAGHSGAEFVDDSNVFNDDHGAVVDTAIATMGGIPYGTIRRRTHPQAEQYPGAVKLTRDLGEKVVALNVHEKAGQPEQSPSEWIKDKNTLNFSSWGNEANEQSYMHEHRDEIIIAFLEHSQNLFFQIHDLMDKVGGGEPFGDKLAYYLIRNAPAQFMRLTEYFTDFAYDMKYVEAMVESERYDLTMDNWRMIQPDCLQSAVNLLLERSASLVFRRLDRLPDSIQISDEYLVVMARELPTVLIDMMREGRFASQLNKEITKVLIEEAGAWCVLDAGLLDKVDIVTLKELWPYSGAGDLVTRLHNCGRLGSLESLDSFIATFGIENAVMSAFRLPRHMQSHIFQEFVTMPGDSWTRYVTCFTELTSDDYIFILDSLDDIEKSIDFVGNIKNLFTHADIRLRAEFESKFEVILRQRSERKRTYEERNMRRISQRHAEESYFEAGSFTIDARDYGAVLSPEEIIELFNNVGCVKRAGTLAEVANDSTRQNIMTCVEGSTASLTTGSLGADSHGQRRRTLTEYEVLQDFMNFMDSLGQENKPDEKVESLKTELTYIGEKEYAEAVRGIAIYWKSFLDSDETAELYVDTVVTGSGKSIKSDAYLLDRILAHFSDEELNKYRGRILTAGAAVSQADPTKVKAVLLDDWTISGTQLRDGYRTFTAKYPQLIESIEVQLIAASEERIALGLEKLVSGKSIEGASDSNVPVKLRAYYVAHKAESATLNDARQTRITGSHSSVDYGFVCDIEHIKDTDSPMPLMASVVRPYRQDGYSLVNIQRLKSINNPGELNHA